MLSRFIPFSTQLISPPRHETNLAQFNTNFFGLINLTNAFLPHLRERKSGTIVNISSQGGWLNISGAGSMFPFSILAIVISLI